MAGKLQIQESFQKVYDLEVFKREILNSIFTTEKAKLFREENYIDESNQLTASEKKAILKVIHYGNLELDDYNILKLYEITLQPKVRIEQSKVGIQQYVRKMLIAGEGVLVNFINPDNLKTWRLTLVASDTILTDKGISVKKLNPKRYTFIVGQSEKCKTISDRFAELEKASRIVLYPSENEKNTISLVNTFSVETLSNAFFDEYTLHYRKFVDSIEKSNYRKSVFSIDYPEKANQKEIDFANKPIRDFVKKLLGRIVFLYFVQKKGWLGATNLEYNDGDPDFIFNLFMSSGANETFYSNWLAQLFFKTLNEQRTNDVFKMPDGITVKIPYLNGGLFDPEDYDNKLLTFVPTLFYSVDFEDIPLTDRLIKKNDLNHRGFLDFLNSFNFTVHEDSPEDHTVAVDPEMLGHIFENLLEDNKDKGAFYTPKEIVHYMCQESLIEYLTTHLSKEYTVYRAIGNQQVELFGNEVAHGQLQMMENLGDKALDREAIASIVKNKDISSLTAQQLTRMSDLLNTVKICDPAIGSGAFPMGLLQEIFAIKELIAFTTNSPWKPAEVKENIIQNSIYGVDIEKGAVDIARLRFWLSLIVNEEKPKALPNLDYKIVVGNSLLSKFEDEIIEIDWNKTGSVGKADDYVKNVQRLLKEVAKKQKEYFKEEGKLKKKIAAEIRDLKIDLLINQLSYNKESYTNKNNIKIDNGLGLSTKDLKNNENILNEIYNFDKNIKKLIALKNDTLKPFNHFDWKLDFPEVLNPYIFDNKDDVGFDIVIGNPPFVSYYARRSATLDTATLRYYQKHYDFITETKLDGKFNTIMFFIEKACRLSNKKANVFYIMDIAFNDVPYRYIRKYLIDNTTINKVITGLSNFKNVYSDQVLLQFSSAKHVDESTYNVEYYKGINTSPAFTFNQNIWKANRIYEFNPPTDNKLDEIYNQMDSFPKLGEIFPAKLIRTCMSLAGHEDEFLFKNNDTKKNFPVFKYIQNAKNFPERYSPIVNPESVVYDEDLKDTLNQYYRQDAYNDVRRQPKALGLGSLHSYISPKIFVRQSADKIIATYTEEKCAANTSFYIINNSNEEGVKINFNLKYLTGILNSQILSFYALSKNIIITGKKKQPQMMIKPFKMLPIPKVEETKEKVIISLVDYILFLKQHQNRNVNNQLIPIYFEQIIDGIVYELFFPDILKQHKRTIIEHLGELPAFTDTMSDAIKTEIITTVFDRLKDKNHPVRVNLLNMNSIPEIKIIEGIKEPSLKNPETFLKLD